MERRNPDEGGSTSDELGSYSWQAGDSAVWFGPPQGVGEGLINKWAWEEKGMTTIEEGSTIWSFEKGVANALLGWSNPAMGSTTALDLEPGGQVNVIVRRGKKELSSTKIVISTNPLQDVLLK